MVEPSSLRPPTERPKKGDPPRLYEVRVEQARIREQCARQRRHAAEMRHQALIIRTQSLDHYQ